MPMDEAHNDNNSNTDAALLAELQALETELHRPATRSDAARLDALLHEDFREIGRSGVAYTKADAGAIADGGFTSRHRGGPV